MNRNQQEIATPGRAFSGLVFALAFTGFWWWLAKQPGLEIAWFGVIAGGVGILETWQRFVDARRAARERERNDELSRQISDIFTTGGRWERPARKDRGWRSR